MLELASEKKWNLGVGLTERKKKIIMLQFQSLSCVTESYIDKYHLISSRYHQFIYIYMNILDSIIITITAKIQNLLTGIEVNFDPHMVPARN